MSATQKSKKDIILILGYGNMASAIALALDRQGKYALEICGRDVQKARDFITKHRLKNATAIESKQPNSSKNDSKDSRLTIKIQDKILLLCVKPKGLSSFCYEGRAKGVYSALAGVNIATLESHISSKYVARLMPNVGARFSLSATAVFIASKDDKSSENAFKNEARQIIESFGNAVFVASENLIDSSIATSGSSPAFLALVAQSLIDAGVQEGLSRVDSALLVKQTFKGFASLLDFATPQEIIEAVTSPAGTTARGLAVLEGKAVRGAFLKACKASVKKARQNSPK
ncbi:pyrroline-5-carboxylate reductase [Helicobacter sp. T3_23-1059]